MLGTHFMPCFGLVWSSLMTIGYRAARSAARYGDGFGADFRPSDVDYESLPSLIGRFEGSGRSGSLRSFDCRIVIGGTRPESRVIGRSVSFFRFHRISVSRGASAPTPRAHPGKVQRECENRLANVMVKPPREFDIFLKEPAFGTYLM